MSAAAGADARAYIGAVLAFVATKDDAAAEVASRAARAAGVPVNVVDRPHLSDFVTPAVIDRGEVVAAVGTGGTAPILASLLRGDIEARVPRAPAASPACSAACSPRCAPPSPTWPSGGRSCVRC